MYISSTGFSYIFLFISLTFLTYRFFQYWQKSKDVTSKAFFFFALFLDLFALVRMISGLFFYNNISVLAGSTVLASFLQGLTASVGVFIIFHLKFPKISPWLGFWLTFSFGLFSTIITGLTAAAREITFGLFGAINWGFPTMGLIYALTRITVLGFAFIPIIIIMIQQGRAASEPRLRKRCFGLAVALSIGIILGLLDYFIIQLMGYEAIIRDIITGVLSILLFFVTYFTQKSPSE
jgi:hypothetical protein